VDKTYQLKGSALQHPERFGPIQQSIKTYRQLQHQDSPTQTVAPCRTWQLGVQEPTTSAHPDPNGSSFLAQL